MSYNEINPYNYPSTQANDFERLGHPGKWLKSVSASGTMWFTGSEYGAGGIVTFDSAAGTAYLSAGGTIDLSKLTKGHIHELSIERIVGAKDSYVLIRNQVVR